MAAVSCVAIFMSSLGPPLSLSLLLSHSPLTKFPVFLLDFHTFIFSGPNAVTLVLVVIRFLRLSLEVRFVAALRVAAAAAVAAFTL